MGDVEKRCECGSVVHTTAEHQARIQSDLDYFATLPDGDEGTPGCDWQICRCGAWRDDRECLNQPDPNYVPPSPAALAKLDAGIESAKTRPIITECRVMDEWRREKDFWAAHPVERFDLETVYRAYLTYETMVKQKPDDHCGDWIRAEDFRKIVEELESRRRC